MGVSLSLSVCLSLKSDIEVSLIYDTVPEIEQIREWKLKAKKWYMSETMVMSKYQATSRKDCVLKLVKI